MNHDEYESNDYSTEQSSILGDARAAKSLRLSSRSPVALRARGVPAKSRGEIFLEKIAGFFLAFLNNSDLAPDRMRPICSPARKEIRN